MIRKILAGCVIVAMAAGSVMALKDWSLAVRDFVMNL